MDKFEPIAPVPQSRLEFTYGRNRLWQAILLAHAVAALEWWWLTPHGFPVSAVRFWSNTFLPWIVAATAAAGCHALERKNGTVAGPIVMAVPVGWTMALTAGCLIFPVSFGRFLLPLAAILFAIWLAYFLGSPVRGPKGFALVTTVAVAAIAGGSLPWSQRSQDAATTPLDIPFPKIGFQKIEPAQPILVPLSEDVRVLTAAGEVTAKCGSLTLEVAPLLTFESRSPDRCWTILAPPSQRGSPRRKLIGQRLTEGQLLLSYKDDAQHVLTVKLDEVTPQQGFTPCLLEAYTRLDSPIFSHLNSYSTITIRGHHKLALAFSPCPDVMVDVEAADYPTGRPSRFGYLDVAGVFHVVEASSGEKGPFHELARGPLDRDAALGISLFDEGNLTATIVFADWASQTCVDLSPTAGWGVPANAIEFLRFGDANDEPAEIWLTLAATSVGRGWDSVGHRAGTYRNRVRIECPATLPASAGGKPGVARP